MFNRAPGNNLQGRAQPRPPSKSTNQGSTPPIPKPKRALYEYFPPLRLSTRSVYVSSTITFELDGNGNRPYLMLQNVSGDTIFVGFGVIPSLNYSGVTITGVSNGVELPSGSQYETPYGTAIDSSIYILSDATSGTSQLNIVEGVFITPPEGD